MRDRERERDQDHMLVLSLEAPARTRPVTHTAAEKVIMKPPEERRLWTDTVSPVRNTV